MKRFLLTVILFVCYLDLAVAAEYYVDPQKGSNNSGTGSRQRPWRTISIALDTTGIRPGPTVRRGDVINVLPGVLNTVPDAEGWPEVFPIRMRNGISLVGVQGASATIIDADSSARAIQYENVSDTTTLIKGFTVRRGNTHGIYCTNAHLKIIENVIENNAGSGIYCVNSSPKIINNIIRNNRVANDGDIKGGGIYIASGSPRIENNSIHHNSIKKDHGTTGTVKGCGIGCDSGSPVIIHNDISDNEIKGWDATGGGIYCGPGDPIIKYNLISHNKSEATFDAWGGGIYCRSTHAIITHNRIVRNAVVGWLTNDGGGIYCDAVFATIVADTITNNTGYGICNWSDASDVKQNYLTRNSTSGIYTLGRDSILFNVIDHSGAAGIYCNSASAVIERNTIARSKSSGITVAKSVARIVNNIIFNNQDYGIRELTANCDPDSCLFNDIFANGSDSTFLYYDEGSTPIKTLPVLHAFVPECKAPWYSGLNNLGSEPLFVYQAGDSIDFHLQGNSPCIDRGHPHSPLDLDGTRADIGAFSSSIACLLGDVNMDGAITPADAMCALQIYLNKGIALDECNTECALDAANANCLEPISPVDGLIIYQAYLDGKQPPLQCPTNMPGLAKIASLQNSTLTLVPITSSTGDTLVVKMILDNPWGLQAFGCDLEYPGDLLQFIKVRKTDLSLDWQVLAGKVNPDNGITLGGFTTHAVTVSRPGVVAEVIFRVKQGATGTDAIYLHSLTDDLAAVQVCHTPIGTDRLVPETYGLDQNYPNPFNPETIISYQLPQDADIKLEIYNMSGQLVRILVAKRQAAGFHSITWNGRDEFGREAASGVYIYRLQANDFVRTRKMVLIR